MGKKHGMNPKKKPGKSENYTSLNDAYKVDRFTIKYASNNPLQQYGHEKILLNWEFNEPKEYYDVLVNMYGNPDVLGHNRGGIAIWGKSLQGTIDPLTNLPNIYEKIEIRDERVKHKCPADHIDFLYSYLKIPITPKQLNDIVKLSGSVNYDMLKHELFARCGSLEANIATLYMCSHIILSHMDSKKYMTIDYIHKHGEYGKHINSTGDPQFVKDMYRELIDNIMLIRQLNTLPNNYWPGAFNSSCGKP
tara:strand:+ start:35 stop:781 length:747 start_codon:yes stop_codon:yes gene_type:complete